MNISQNVRLYAADLNKTEYDYDYWYSLMPEKRIDKTDRFRFDADKRRSVLGWALICTALFEYAGLDAKYIAQNVYASDKGKMYINMEASDCNKEVYFNLAHAENMVICAVSDSEVGCDVEKKNCDGLVIAKRFFALNEYKYLKQLEEDTTDREFLRIWTLKEAFVKMLGDGLSFPIEQISFVDDDDHLCNMTEYDGNKYLLWQTFFEDGYSAAVCIKGNTCSNINVDVKYLFVLKG